MITFPKVLSNSRHSRWKAAAPVLLVLSFVLLALTACGGTKAAPSGAYARRLRDVVIVLARARNSVSTLWTNQASWKQAEYDLSQAHAAFASEARVLARLKPPPRFAPIVAKLRQADALFLRTTNEGLRAARAHSRAQASRVAGDFQTAYNDLAAAIAELSGS